MGITALVIYPSVVSKTTILRWIKATEGRMAAHGLAVDMSRYVQIVAFSRSYPILT